MQSDSARSPGTTSRLYHARSHDGWKYLLPVGTHGRVACVDGAAARTTLALSNLCHEVVAVPLVSAAAADIRAQVEAAGCTNVRIVEPVGEWCPGSEPLDGLVMTVGGASGRAGDPPAPVPRRQLKAILRDAHGALTDDGFIFASAANVLAYNGMWSGDDRPDSTLCTAGAAPLGRLVRRAGYRHGRVFPLLTWNDRQVVQVLMPSGYRSFTDVGGYAEQLRELLLGRLGSRVCAPEYGVLAFKGDSRASLFEALVEHCDEQVDGVSSPSAVKRYVVLADKIILSLGGDSGAHGDRVVVVPRTEAGARQRRHEALILKQARRLPDALRMRVPRWLGTGEFLDTSFVVIEELRGLCIDAPVRDLEPVCTAAADFLVDLHRHSRADLRMDEAAWDDLCGSFFHEAVQRHQRARAMLERIEAHVRTMLMGTSIPTVWVHGDFKIENVVVDRATRRPTGVIDWELSQLRGLPLIDPLYLLTYNHMLRRGEGFGQVFSEVTLSGAWTPWESALLENYVAQLRLDPALMDAMVAMLPVHALARRLTYDMSSTHDRRAAMGMLEALIASLDAGSWKHRGSAPTGTYG